MNTYSLQGLFDFKIEMVSNFSSFKIETSDGRVMSAVVRGRIPGGMFPKKIDIIDDVTGTLLMTIEGNNFFGSSATVKIVRDNIENPVCEIEFNLKGILIFIGRVIIAHSSDDDFTVYFDSPAIIQQIKATLPHQSMVFPITFNKGEGGELEVSRSFFGGHACSFRTSEGQNTADNNTSGIIVLAGALWLLRKLISCTGP